MKPFTRLEHFLAKIAGDEDAKDIKPITRKEYYLNEIADNAIILTGIWDEELDVLVGYVANRPIYEFNRNPMVAIVYDNDVPMIFWPAGVNGYVRITTDPFDDPNTEIQYIYPKSDDETGLMYDFQKGTINHNINWED